MSFFLEMSIKCDHTKQLRIQLSLEIVLLNENAVNISAYV